jgi:glutamate racemase
MIGVFDSGLGGLTVLRRLTERFPGVSFTYFGDHAHVPYGDRPSDEIVELTRAGVVELFERGCGLVILGCNTATTIAARALQQAWLPQSRWRDGHNVLGIVAPTVEAATQTPWAVTEPQYPQKYNTNTIVVFGTTRTIASGVYTEEISKRCPRVSVVPVACPGLVDAIEQAGATDAIDERVARFCSEALADAAPNGPDYAILGCTHYPLICDLFVRHLPPRTRVLSQPDVVADSLEDYLTRHPAFAEPDPDQPPLQVLTSGDVAVVGAAARRFWSEGIAFQSARHDRSL